MKLTFPKYTWPVCRGCLRTAGTLALWVFWAALALLLYMQLRIAASDEITIPDDVLRNAETRLAERGLRFTFGAIQCDSQGNMLVRDLRLFAQAHEDPVLIAKAVRFSVNPYALLMHSVTPRAMRIDGASLRMPAMFSSDGTNAALIDDINTDIEFTGTLLAIKGFTGRIGNLSITSRGAITIPPAAGRPRKGADALSGVISSYLQIARQIVAHLSQIEMFDQPSLDITLTPDAERLAIAKIEFAANSLHVDKPAPAFRGQPGKTLFALGPLEARSALSLAALDDEDAARKNPLLVQFSTTDVLVPELMRASGARATATMPMADVMRLGQQSKAKPAEAALSINLTLDSLTARGITARALTVNADGVYPQNLRTRATTRVLGDSALIEADANLQERSANVHLVTPVSPRHIAALSRETKQDIGAILKPAHPIKLDARTRLGAGWKFTGAHGNLDIGPIHAYRVDVDRARGEFAYDHATGTLLFKPATATIGESFARGSYEMNLRTMDYRFLLKGQLRPLAIRGWFGGAWWPAFWDHFSFDGAAPLGDADVRGNWKKPSATTVFIFSDATKLTYNSVHFEHALLRMFMRPDFYDALEVVATRDGGFARGSFTHENKDPGNRTLRTKLDFSGENIDPTAIAPAISPAVVKGLAPFKFTKALSRVKVSGEIDGPASPRGEHVSLDIEADGVDSFSYAGMPFADLSTHLVIRDDVVDIERLTTQVAGGHLVLKAQLSGPGESQQLGFDLTLNRVSLGQTIQIIENYAASRRGEPPGPASKIQAQLASGQLDLRISADGRANDPLSFTGNGNAEVMKAELVNLYLFGSLSQALRGVRALNFTSLNLTGGQVNFVIDRRKILFPEAIMTGQRALVKLNGEYALDTDFANLTAKMYPLSGSKGLLGKGLGFLLVPVTHLAEMKLTGSLSAPKWRFSYGPTSLFQAIIGKKDEAEPAPETEAKPSPVPETLLRRE